MAIIIEVNGNEVEFPDGTSEDQIRQALMGESAKPAFDANAGDYLESALQGATFGWSDELQAGMKTGAGLWGDYEKERAAIDDRHQQFQQSSPVASIGGEIAGGIATGGVGGAKVLGSQVYKNAAPLAKAGMISLLGGAEGGAYGAGTAAPGERLEGGATGAAVGSVAAPLLGGAANLAGKGLGKGAALLGQKATETPTREGNRILRKMADDANLSPDDIIGRYRTLGPQGMLMDTDDTMRGAARGVFDMGGEARSTMRNLVDSRQTGQIDRLKDATRGAISGDDATDSVKALIASRSKQAGPLYESAKQAPVSQEMMDLVENRPSLKSALNQARKLAGDMGETLPEGEASFQQFHYAKQAIDGMIGRAQRAGDNTKARSLMSVKKDLLSAMDEASPDYKQARQIFAGESSLIDAIDKGRQAFKPNATLREFDDLVDGLTDSEMEMFRRGAVQALLEKMDNTQFTHDSAKKLVNTPAMQGKLMRLFKSPDDAAAFITQAGREAEFTKSRQALGGSMTSSNRAMQEELKGSANSIGAFAADAGMDATTGGMTSSILRNVAQFFGKNGVRPETINHITRVLTDQGLSDQQIREVFSRSGVINAMPDLSRLGGATYGAAVPAAAPLLGGGQ